MTESRSDKPRLVRAMGFWMLTAYGVGDILGAGIYALVGEIANVAGSLSWLSFLLAGIVASLTGLTYAELGGRFPYSGGEAYFVQQALHRPRLAFLTGWLVFCSGLVSIATIARAFTGYASHLIPDVSQPLAITLLISTVAIITFIGIRVSSSTNALCTMIETAGLLLVAGSAWFWLLREGLEPNGPAEIASAASSSLQSTDSLRGVFQGAALAFFAFIGFEDMVNVAEEVHEPERTMPKALLTALGIATVVYILVVMSATFVVPAKTLADSDAPLLSVIATSWPGFPLGIFSLIALFAVANTGLANFVTSSRLVFGMSRQNLLPGWLARVNPKTHTPDAAIAACFVVGLVLALSGSLGQLAGATSFLILVIFALMNLSLILIRRRDKTAPTFRTPAVVPYIALICCLGLLCFVSTDAALAALAIVAAGLLLSFLTKGERPISHDSDQFA